jgi:hypothetical protein
MGEWSTRVPPEVLQRHGIQAEAHFAHFAPPGWPGEGSAVSLLIPECELQVVVIGPDDRLWAMKNEPGENRDVVYWIGAACWEARFQKAVLTVACDTEGQVLGAIRIIEGLLPRYERIPNERFWGGDTRLASKLS